MSGALNTPGAELKKRFHLDASHVFAAFVLDVYCARSDCSNKNHRDCAGSTMILS